MTIIKATCPTCGEVDLTAEQVELRISAIGEGGTYGFECPACASWISKPADSRIVQLLISGGVKPEVVDGDEDEDRFEAPFSEFVASFSDRLPDPPLTYDDLLDFHLALQGANTVEALFNISSR